MSVSQNSISGRDALQIQFRAAMVLVLAALMVVPVCAGDGSPPASVNVSVNYNDDTPGYGEVNFSSIQPALDKVAEYGTVHVLSGTYTESIVVSTAGITLVAEEPATIDALGADAAVTIDAVPDVTIAGFAVTNATIRGIAAVDAENLAVRGNTISLDLAWGEGIYLLAGSHASVTENTISLMAPNQHRSSVRGVRAYTGDLEISNNTLLIGISDELPVSETTAEGQADRFPREGRHGSPDTGELLDDIIDVEARSARMGSPDTGILLAEGDEWITEVVGLYTIGDRSLIHGNVVEVHGISTGDVEGTAYNAYVFGIFSEGDETRALQNTVNTTGRAETYAYLEAVSIWHEDEGGSSVVEGNAVTSFAEAGERVGTYGIIVFGPQVQVRENTVRCDTLTGDDATRSIELDTCGIFLGGCYPAGVAENSVVMNVSLLAGSASGPGDISGLPIVAEIGGIQTRFCDGAVISDNEVDMGVVLLGSAEGDESAAVGTAMRLGGIYVVDADAQTVLNNNVSVDAYTWNTANASSSGADPEGFGTRAGLMAEVGGIALSNVFDATVDGNHVAMRSDFGADALALRSAGETDGDTSTSVGLDARTAGVFLEMGGSAEITNNCINISMAAASTSRAVTDLDTDLTQQDTRTFVDSRDAATFGILFEGDEATIAGNTVVVDLATRLSATAFDGISLMEAGSVIESYGTTGTGILSAAPSSVIESNEVQVTVESASMAQSVEENPGELAGAGMAGIYSRATGILAEGDAPVLLLDGSDATVGSQHIANNTILVRSTLDAGAVSLSAGEATAFSLFLVSAGGGIESTPGYIGGNTVEVHADAGGTAVARSSQEAAGAGGQVIGFASGIATEKSLIEGNTVRVHGNASGTVVAETAGVLEGAVGRMIALGLGEGISDSADSVITRNTVEGHGTASTEGSVAGYRSELINSSAGYGIGIRSSGGSRVFYNNLAGSDTFGLSDGSGLPDDLIPLPNGQPVDARYNWWGDASGPSGLGPGIGDAVDVPGYEPWLTRPYETVLDGNQPYLGIELRPGDSPAPGWNTLSVPIALENNTWQAIHSMGGGLNYSVAYTWDAAAQRWVQVFDGTRISPLDAVYVRMNEGARLPIAVSPEHTNPPQKTLRAGWNLIGPAYAFDPDTLTWDEKAVDAALVSVEKTPQGLLGYTIALSPSINRGAWSYTVGASEPPTMEPGYGYWVFMENTDILAGFSQTPLRLPEIDLGTVAPRNL